MSVATSVLLSLGLALLLAASHLAAPRLRQFGGLPERAVASLAGGLAVAYVFLHLLPEVAAGNEAIGEALSDVVTLTPLLELAIFAVAMAGFLVFYGLERLAGHTAERKGHSEPGVAVYRLHLASFMMYNGLITYSMALRVRTGLLFAVLFTLAMGLHFVLTDRTFSERYPRRFRATGRVFLAGALLAGWLLDAAFAPTNTLIVTLLTAFLAGSVLLNVFKEEIPSSRRSSFPWFVGGLTGYASLLAVVTALSG